MAFNISGASIRRPIPAMVLFSVLAVLGIFAFRAIPVTLSPNIDIPAVTVTVTQSGASPAELEAQVTRKIEDAVSGVTGVKHIASTVTDGSSVTKIELRLEISSDRALNDVRDAVSKVRADLPRTIDEPVIERLDFTAQPIRAYAASAAGMTLEQLSWFVDDTVTRDLQGVRGIGQILRIGGVTREIQVALDSDRLSALGITAGDVNAQVQATSVDLAGGRGELGRREQSIRTLAGATTITGLAATRIVLPGGREVRLADLGTVRDAVEEPREFARLNGTTPVVAFRVFRSKGSSDVTVAGLVEQRLAALARAHPGVSYTQIDDTVRTSIGSYHSAMQALLEGAVLSTLVVLLFLRDWRATLLSAVALPLSVLPAFAVMLLLGFTLNFISLLAITLVTGILVDDAIVEIENIVRHIRMGKRPYEAAIEAADEIGLAVIAITLTICAVFAPVSFMPGVSGQYFKQFGLTVAAAVLTSLLVARLLTPVMAAYLLKPHNAAARQGGVLEARLVGAYTRFLEMTLRHRGRTLLVGLATFALSIASTSLLPTAFIPDEDQSRSVLSIELPPGSRLEDTSAKTDEIARAFLRIPEVASVFVTGGTTPTGDDAEIRRAGLTVNLKPRAERHRSQKQVEQELSARLADIADVRGYYINSRGERELALTVMSNDPVALETGIARLETALRRLKGFSNVAASTGLDGPQILITPRIDEAARFGISTQAISEAVRIATIGDIPANLAKFRDGERLIPIRVQTDTGLRRDLHAIEALPVTGATGLSVPLATVADVTLGEGPSSIQRYDRQREVVLGADLARGLALGAALKTVKALPEAVHLPAGVHFEDRGDAEIMDEVFTGFSTAMGSGLMIVLALLVLLFGSLFQPLTVLLSLPLCLGGVIAALLLTGQPISLPVAIGILMLMGIVTKNAIMLVDFAKERQAGGMSRREAIIDAGSKRARPIVMTTIAMVAGMLPSAFGVGDGGAFRAPMAIGVIGGLIVSTVLSLVFVPSLYMTMDALSQRSGAWFGSLLTAREASPQAAQPAPSTAGPSTAGPSAFGPSAVARLARLAAGMLRMLRRRASTPARRPVTDGDA